MTLRTVLSAVALASAACGERETASLGDQRAEVAHASAEVAHASAGLTTAELDFAAVRGDEVRTLRQRYRIHAIQAGVVRGLVAAAALGAADHADAVERVLAFERELGEAEQAIDSLATATAAQWEVAKATVDNAFDQLAAAERDAYRVISPA